jgi:N-acetylneuraminic acid mutarotase
MTILTSFRAPIYGMIVSLGLVLPAMLASCGPSEEPEPSSGAATVSAGVWQSAPPLPQPITNNAVAAVDLDGRVSVFTFLGLDSTRVWSGVTNVAYRWDVGDDAWRTIPPVPGPGRLASTAQVVDGLIYVIGGYTVAEDGGERSLPDVAIYDPETDSWGRGADIPVPTDDAVSGVLGGDRIVLVSGWHDTGNIRDVQIYHPASDRWSSGTPIPGAPVFGHTGAVVGDYVVYADGAALVDGRPRFQIETASWVGAFTETESSPGVGDVTVAWSPARPHPGPPIYRAAAGTLGSYALFIGGTDNPYNYSGIGYDGMPARPLHQILAYAPAIDVWDELTPLPVGTMDHRNAPVAGGRIFVVGGMLDGQVVSDQVFWADVVDLLEAR